MSDQGKPANHDQDPQAPKFMRPQRPVFDEPLEEGEVPEQGELDAQESDIGKAPDHEAENLDATQELKTPPESSRQPEPNASETKTPEPVLHSPYFPRGVYEDARSVEAYYGRGAGGETEGSTPDKGPAPLEPVRGRGRRWLIFIFAFLMVLVLLFLALTEGIPVGIF